MPTKRTSALPAASTSPTVSRRRSAAGVRSQGCASNQVRSCTAWSSLSVRAISWSRLMPSSRYSASSFGDSADSFKPALHRQHRHAEARRHVLDALALVDQRLEGLELVGRVHGLAPAVLGEADLQRPLGRHQLAQHLVLLRQAPALLQQQHRAPPPLTGRDRELQLARLAPADLLLGDHQVVQQALRLDQRRQFLDLTDRVTPDVEPRRHQADQRHREQLLRVFHDDELHRLMTLCDRLSTTRHGGTPGQGKAQVSNGTATLRKRPPSRLAALRSRLACKTSPAFQ